MTLPFPPCGIPCRPTDGQRVAADLLFKHPPSMLRTCRMSMSRIRQVLYCEAMPKQSTTSESKAVAPACTRVKTRSYRVSERMGNICEQTTVRSSSRPPRLILNSRPLPSLGRQSHVSGGRGRKSNFGGSRYGNNVYHHIISIPTQHNQANKKPHPPWLWLS